MNALLIEGLPGPASAGPGAAPLLAAVQRHLKERGHALRREADREEALARFADDPPDLVVLDVGADRSGGLDWCRRLRRLPAAAWCVLLVVAAELRLEDLEEAIGAGADDYLLWADGEEVVALRLALAEHRFEDRAARRSALSALSRSETRLRDLLETAPDAILRIDSEGRIGMLNEQAELLTGYRREELLGQPVEVLVPAAKRDAHVLHRQRFFARPATRPMGTGLELWLRRKNGAEVAVDICLGFHREDGQPYAVAAIRDITERRRMEQELRLAKQAAERAYERIRQDLQAAAGVQQSLLPTRAPQVPGARLAWRYLPCADLGGDGLNVFPAGPSRLGAYLLDVSGHGVAAALLSVSLARQLPPQNMDRADAPGEVATRLNRWLLADPANEQFFTMVYGILDVGSLVFRYVSAGHLDLLHLSAAGEARFEPGLAMPVGIRPDAMFPEQELQLRPGDTLLLYSDGIIESQDAERRLFGRDRLCRCVVESRAQGLDACVDRVLHAVEAWAGGASHDDVSVLALTVEGQAGWPECAGTTGALGDLGPVAVPRDA
jgi:sigma-B regulation protein RsbU (phosphoserine phosphatase)